jgi:diguanylate cyclase (GGDEF)-like protein/PAS domain S-box-containing protein
VRSVTLASLPTPAESDGDLALRAACEAYVAMDAAGRVLRWNAAAAKLFGYEPAAVIGRDLADLIVPEHLRAAHRAGVQRYLSTRLGRIVGRRTEVTAVDRAGRIFPAELALWAVRGTGQPWFAAMIRDVSDVVTARDASRSAATTARAAQRELATLVSHAPIGMALVGLDGQWLVVNPALARLTGYSEPELLTRTFQAITHPDDLDADLELLRQLVDGDITDYTLEKRYRRQDGTFIWVSLSVSLVRDDTGAPVHFISQIQDITDRRINQQALERRALTDSLTGLADRGVLDEATRQALMELNRTHGQVGLLLLDLDNFKPINDTHGHLAGDAVLIEIARRLLANARGRDLAARFGGDEFAILLDAPGDPDAQIAVGQRLLTALRAPITLPGGTSVELTASIGIASTNDPGCFTAALYGRADRGLYAVKTAGGNNVHVDDIGSDQTPAPEPTQPDSTPVEQMSR